MRIEEMIVANTEVVTWNRLFVLRPLLDVEPLEWQIDSGHTLSSGEIREYVNDHTEFDFFIVCPFCKIELRAGMMQCCRCETEIRYQNAEAEHANRHTMIAERKAMVQRLSTFHMKQVSEGLGIMYYARSEKALVERKEKSNVRSLPTHQWRWDNDAEYRAHKAGAGATRDCNSMFTVLPWTPVDEWDNNYGELIPNGPERDAMIKAFLARPDRPEKAKADAAALAASRKRPAESFSQFQKRKFYDEREALRDEGIYVPPIAWQEHDSHLRIGDFAKARSAATHAGVPAPSWAAWGTPASSWAATAGWHSQGGVPWAPSLQGSSAARWGGPQPQAASSSSSSTWWSAPQTAQQPSPPTPTEWTASTWQGSGTSYTWDPTVGAWRWATSRWHDA